MLNGRLLANLAKQTLTASSNIATCFVTTVTFSGIYSK